MSRRFGSRPCTVASMSSTTSSSASFSLKILTAFSGSPTYCPSPNRTVLTSPPFLTRRHGVIRGLSTSHVREVLEKPGAEMTALFRMELHAADVAGADGTAEIRPVVRDRYHLSGIVALEEVGVQEVEPRIFGETVEQRVPADGPHV